MPDLSATDAGSTVRVAIRDTSLADALHPTIAEATGTLKPDSEAELSVELPRERLDPRHRYSLWAHVDHHGDGEIRPGDLITTQNVPVRREDVDRGRIEVPLTRI
jgi:Type III secretion system lipoprotein chaperone (YscW)